MAGFHDAALHFLQSYGFLALFVLLALETSMILHFVPSEAVVTVAAAALAKDATGLALVIAVSTLGATVGSLMLYAFARGGGRRLLERHPHLFGLTAERRERMEAWFQRPAGESLVFFLRLLPFLRAAVSIPAGLAKMDLRKFTLYSAAGSGLFNAALAYSAYAVHTHSGVTTKLHALAAYAAGRWPLLVAILAALLAVVYIVYRRRRLYRRAPELAVRHVLRASAIAAIAAGAVIVALSLMAPSWTYGLMTWVAAGGGETLERFGASPLLVLLAYAFGAITVGLVALTVAPALERGTRTVVRSVRS